MEPAQSSLFLYILLVSLDNAVRREHSSKKKRHRKHAKIKPKDQPKITAEVCTVECGVLLHKTLYSCIEARKVDLGRTWLNGGAYKVRQPLFFLFCAYFLAFFTKLLNSLYLFFFSYYLAHCFEVLVGGFLFIPPYIYVLFCRQTSNRKLSSWHQKKKKSFCSRVRTLHCPCPKQFAISCI